MSRRGRAFLVLGSALTPIVLMLVSLWIAWASTVAQLDERLIRTLDVVHEHARRVLQTADQTIATVAAEFAATPNDELAAQEDVAHRRLAVIANSTPEVEAIWLFDAVGRPLASSAIHPVPRDLDNSDRDYIRAHAEADAGLFVGQNIAARIGNLTFFVLSRRRTVDGASAGVIALTLPPARITPFYEAIARGTSTSVGIFRADGAPLARYPLPVGGLLHARTTEAFTAQLRITEGEGRYRVVSGLDQRERIIAYKRLESLPIYATAAMEASAYKTAFIDRAMPLALINLPLSLLLGFATWFPLSRSSALAAQTRRREEAEMALRHSQRLESLGQLTGGVAHDFNNLLAVVIGNMDLLAKRVSDPIARRLVESTRRAGERGASLTSRMLVFARRQQLREEVVDLAELIGSVSELIERSIGTSHTLHVEAQAHLYARVDPGQLEVALLNLVLNARDASESGLIEIHLRGLDEPDAPRLAIEVRDRGHGTDAETLARAREPFFTTKGVGKGTGLGLSMVHGLAEEWGGELRIASSPGAGTTAAIVLPLASKPVEAEEVATRLPDRAAPNPCSGAEKLRILVVDDDALVLMNTVMMAEDLGHDVVGCHSAQEALDVLAKSSFDLVITDHSMPQMSGMELAALIAQRFSKVKVLLVTGYAELNATSNEVPILNKPFKQEELEATVNKLLGCSTLSVSAS